MAEEGVFSGERGQYRLEKAPTEFHISPTVQGVLAARIDRLAVADDAVAAARAQLHNAEGKRDVIRTERAGAR